MSSDDKAALPVAEPAASTPIGLRVDGRYRIVAEVGRGAFGEVHLAEDEATHHQVAIRLLPRAAGASDAVLGQPRLGPSIVTASTAHPGLVRVFAFGQTDDGQPFAAMEFVQGRPLSDVLQARGTPLDIPAALRLALNVGEAIEALHNMGRVHGAVRPCNVRVQDDGSVKLTDTELIGLREAPAPSGEGVIAAEPPAEYLAPEQLRRALLSEKTDTYTFAIVVYETLCGTPPFRAATRKAIVDKQLTETPAPMRRWRRAVPVSVERVLIRALDKRPERRPSLAEVLNGLVVESHRRAPPARRPTAIIGGAALATLAALAMLIVVPAASRLFAPRPASAPGTGHPRTPPAPERAAVDGIPPPSARVTEAGPAPSGEAAAREVSAAVLPAPRLTLPPAPAAPKVQRQEPPRVVPRPTSTAPPRAAARNPEATTARPPAAPNPDATTTAGRRSTVPNPDATPPAGRRSTAPNADDAYDPGAVIDWLLSRPGGRD